MESLIKGSLLVHEAFLYMQWLGDILGGKKRDRLHMPNAPRNGKRRGIEHEEFSGSEPVGDYK